MTEGMLVLPMVTWVGVEGGGGGGVGGEEGVGGEIGGGIRIGRPSLTTMGTAGEGKEKMVIREGNMINGEI